MMDPIIELHRVTKRYGRVLALHDISFAVPRGQVCALWGPNGAGKTTAFRCILGMTPFEGAIRVDGVDVAREGRRARAMMGYVPQQLPHYDLPVVELVRFVSRVRAVGMEQARDMAQRLGLGDYLARPVAALSGGLKQRLAVALALVGHPRLLLLDEPTAHLDARGRDELFELFHALKAQGLTLLVASHRPEEVALLADWVVVIEQGRLVGIEDAPGWYARHAARVAGRRAQLAGVPGR